MNSDWTDSLAALRASLPGADEAPDEASVTDAGPTVPVKPGNRQLTLTYERKQRKGKPATIVSGFDCSESELLEIASQLKKKLATGEPEEEEKYSYRATGANSSAQSSPQWVTG